MRRGSQPARVKFTRTVTAKIRSEQISGRPADNGKANSRMQATNRLRRLRPLTAVSSALSSALLAWVALAPAVATAQQMFKWTDESGQVHYSDHAPPGQTTTNVPLPKAPKPSKPVDARGAGSPYAANNSSGNQHERTPQQAAQVESEA